MRRPNHQDRLYEVVNHLNRKEKATFSSMRLQKMLSKYYKDLSMAYVTAALNRYQHEYHPVVVYVSRHERQYLWSKVHPCPKNSMWQTIKFTLRDIFGLW